MKKIIQYKEIIEKLNELYPSELAEEWDHIGNQFGHTSDGVQRVMTTLDVRLSVVDEAIEKGIDLIVCHHPVIFSAIDQFDFQEPDQYIYEKLIKHDIKVFVLHTNLDRQWNGMNDWLTEALQLQEIQPLEELTETNNPSLGRVGNLEKPKSREDVLGWIQSQLKADYLGIIEATPKNTYQRIAIVGGSAIEYATTALRAQADIFITGDITYHKAQSVETYPMMVVDAGHYIEHIFIHKMAQIMKKLFPELDIIESERVTNPIKHFPK